MAICGPGTCDCAFTSDTLTITRDGNVITLEQAEFSDITELEEAVANLQANEALLPGTYVNTTGDSMTGTLRIASTGQQIYLTRTDAGGPHIGFYAPDGTTRYGYLHHNGTDFILNNEAATLLRFLSGGVERARFSTSVWLIGKTASSLATAGHELHQNGTTYATGTVASMANHVSNKAGAADANGQVHMSIRSASTQIGSITRATPSTTGFNTSSDEDLKMNIMPVDDELAEWVARIVEPYMFEFKKTPGDVMCGYVAQRMAAVWPESITLGIVTPGFGNIEDRTWDDDGNETTPDGVWQQWQLDYGKMTPIIHAAWQATDRKLTALTARVEALETT